MRRVALVLEYEGTSYAGWQRQPQAPTVQAAVEDALARLVQAPCRVVGSGRTDAGVHALGQVAHADLDTGLSVRQIRDGLNALLPPDVAVRAVCDVASDFHARRDARGRVYRYLILARPHPSALLRRYAHHVPDPLNLSAMASAAAALLGRHDFAAFRITGTPTATTICHVRALRITSRGPLLVVTVAADRFLRQMVRRMVGSLLLVGRGRLPADAIAPILASRDPQRAGPAAPACGLYLVRVVYPPDRLRVVPEDPVL
ncbi:MAG: tRNA pseudouridine(38-40) synthase TruA [Armatimonadota bacterium]|nr:tRNA pseudouridine(38-40) synthase TruA [Armatimonadota bacterium]